MKEENIKNIIFDFDGVLVDSFEFAYKVSLKSNPKLKKIEYRNLFKGNIYKNLKKYKIVENKDFFVYYNEYFKNLKIDLKIKRKILELSKKYRLDIISSTDSVVIREFLEYNNILKKFDKILGSDISESKVKKFELLIENKNFSINNTYFITDTTGDIKEAKKFGIKNIIAVWEWTWQDKKELEGMNPKIILKSIINI